MQDGEGDYNWSREVKKWWLLRCQEKREREKRGREALLVGDANLFPPTKELSFEKVEEDACPPRLALLVIRTRYSRTPLSENGQEHQFFSHLSGIFTYPRFPLIRTRT